MMNLTNTTELGVPPLGVVDYALGVVLFVIVTVVGISIDREVFAHCLAQRRAWLAVVLGISCQFILFPLMGFIFSLIFLASDKEDDSRARWIALGIIVTTASPGGNISAVLCRWARAGDMISISVIMTVCSTLISFGASLMWIVAYGSYWGVDATLDFVGLVISLALVVGPLGLGFLLGFYLEKETRELIAKIGDIVSGVFILTAIILVAVIEWSSVELAFSDYRVWVPAMLGYPLALCISYGLTILAGYKPACARTIGIEAATQNTIVSISIIQYSLRRPYDHHGEIVSAQRQRELALGFPFLFTGFSFIFAVFVLVPLAHWQANYNEENGISEVDEELIAPKDDETQTTAEDGTGDDAAPAVDDSTQTAGGDVREEAGERKAVETAVGGDDDEAELKNVPVDVVQVQ